MPFSPPIHRPAHLPSIRQARLDRNKEYNQNKRTGQEFYKTRAWKRFRAWFVKQNPLCIDCKANGRVTAVKIVDHIVPIKDGGAPLDPDNCQSLCLPCHNTKTSKERGRAGQKSTD